MFGHGQDAKLRALEELARQLQLDVKALARDHVDLDACVAKWMKRDRERERREVRAGGIRPGAGAVQGDTEVATPGIPRGLRGARLRIWQRKFGRSANGSDEGTPALDGTEPVAHPLNELGNEFEQDGGHDG
jgi:hypothetical protein